MRSLPSPRALTGRVDPSRSPQPLSRLPAMTRGPTQRLEQLDRQLRPPTPHRARNGSVTARGHSAALSRAPAAERVGHVAFGAPGRYLQGPGLLQQLLPLVKEFGAERPLLVADPFVHRLLCQRSPALGACAWHSFAGECTAEEVPTTSRYPARTHHHILIAYRMFLPGGTGGANMPGTLVRSDRRLRRWEIHRHRQRSSDIGRLSDLHCPHDRGY